MSFGLTCTEITYLQDSAPYFQKLKPLGQRVWLDSGRPASLYGRYDIISAAPARCFINPDIEALQVAAASVSSTADNTVEHLPFCGGLLGYFNYEYAHSRFQIDNNKAGCTDSVFALYHWALVQDHELHKAYIVFLPECSEILRSKVLTCVESEVAQENTDFGAVAIEANLSRAEYLEAFACIQEYILAGDSYQINFSQRFCGKFNGQEDLTYLALRKVLPSPYCAYLEITDDVILSFSPERFIRVSPDKKAQTQPIKGTIARGATPQEDKNLAQQLLQSEKNRAENLMIVDLLRNDFSQHCEPFSVQVPKLFELESYPNVHHLVSTIEGKIADSVSVLEFFLSCFPGGSITGAPKKRAMEIIDELEPTPRNIYCGSVCYLSANGNFDSNIAIRTLLVHKKMIYCWGGGGIVADSVGDDEFEESVQKIAVLIKALNGSNALSN